MSANANKLNIETFVIPGEGENPSEVKATDQCDWNDFDIGEGGEEGEMTYESPKRVSMETLKRLKRERNLGVGVIAVLGKVA